MLDINHYLADEYQVEKDFYNSLVLSTFAPRFLGGPDLGKQFLHKFLKGKTKLNQFS
jgi:hypothetical protein